MKPFLPALLFAGLLCACDHATPAQKEFQQTKAEAERGEVTAQYNLGVYYRDGAGVKKNDAEAVKWFRAAAEKGLAMAQNNLGFCYSNGQGVETDDAEAVKWFRKAAENKDAEKGLAMAQSQLGYFYEQGKGVEKDDVEAAKWYRKAAEQGDAVAQANLGRCYRNGLGVEKDSTEAVKWLRKAAEQGFAGAQLLLANCYNSGEGIQRDYKEAVKWWRKAAEQGLAEAQFQLGVSYRTGIGVKSDQMEAMNWLRKAAEQDYPGVQEDLSVLEKVTASSKGIDMVRDESGILKIPVQINDTITLKFVIDSGASETQLPKDVVLTLIRAETIKETDFLPGKTFVLADGSTVKSDRFVLRSIKVGQSNFANVEASIGNSNAQLLLGQSFLSRLKEWKIDNKNARLILTE